MIMTVEDCVKGLKETFKGRDIKKIIEYDNMFVVHLDPVIKPDQLPGMAPFPAMDACVSVEKATGNVRPFQPFMIPRTELMKGKEVKISK